MSPVRNPTQPTLPDAGVAVPEGFAALAMGGDFQAHCGPLYRRVPGRPTADGEPVARASGVFRIGPVFERVTRA